MFTKIDLPHTKYETNPTRRISRNRAIDIPTLLLITHSVYPEFINHPIIYTSIPVPIPVMITNLKIRYILNQQSFQREHPLFQILLLNLQPLYTDDHLLFFELYLGLYHLNYPIDLKKHYLN